MLQALILDGLNNLNASISGFASIFIDVAPVSIR